MMLNEDNPTLVASEIHNLNRLSAFCCLELSNLTTRRRMLFLLLIHTMQSQIEKLLAEYLEIL